MATTAASAVRWTDIGCNMLSEMFDGVYRGKKKHQPDVNAVLERAWEAQIDRLIVTAGSLEESREAIRFAEAHGERVFCTVGVHPTRCLSFEQREDGTHASTEDERDTLATAHLEALREEMRRGQETGKVVAIGECGLDYDREEFCPREVQQRRFDQQLQLAEESRLPCFFHNRNTGGDFAEVLRRNRDRFTGGVVHSFDGSWEEASELLDLGLYIGVNGCSLKTEDNLEVARRIPSERLLVETDAPWCTIRPSHAGSAHVKTRWPQVKRSDKWEQGKCVKDRCEPCHIWQVGEVLAAVRGQSVEEIASITTRNAEDLFFAK